MATQRQYDTPIDEVVDRLRRIETRLTRFMEFSGFDTQVARAQYSDGVITIPNLSISLKEVMETIPENTEVRVVLNGLICYIHKL